MVRLTSVPGAVGSASRIGRVGVLLSCTVVCIAAGITAGCDRNRDSSDAVARGAAQTWVDQDVPISALAGPPSTQPIAMPEPRIIYPDGEEEEEDGVATTQPIEVDPLVPVRRTATLIYPSRHVRSEILGEAVEGLISPEGSIQSSPSLNSLVISDDRANVASVLKVLKELDRPLAQLLVETRVIEVRVDNDLEYEIRHALNIPDDGEDANFLRDSGIDFRTPGAEVIENQGAQFVVRPWFHDGQYLEQAIRVLLKRGKARILSSPNLLVSPGTEASIITGEEVPVLSTQVVAGSLSTNTQFKRVGIKLRVSLLQMTGDAARIEINPEVSTVTRFTQPGDQIPSNPIIAIRSVNSTLTMKDGEILTVGGLLTDSDRLSLRGIPLLMDIPGLGLLFQSRRHQVEKTQLIFFLRIHILNEGSTYAARVHRPGSSMERIEEKSGIVLPDVPRRKHNRILEGPKPADAPPSEEKP